MDKATQPCFIMSFKCSDLSLPLIDLVNVSFFLPKHHRYNEQIKHQFLRQPGVLVASFVYYKHYVLFFSSINNIY